MAYCESNILTEDMPANFSTEFTLYVNNLPEELNEHGFLQIFNHYGKVIGHFYRPNVSWGYITYGTSREAQNAIKDLNNVPPLRLKVSISRNRESKDAKFVKAPIHEEERCDIKQEIKPVDRSFIQAGRGQPLDAFKRIEPKVGLPSYDYTADNDLLYKYPIDPHTYNPYENMGPHRNTDTLWTRGQVTILQNGKRHVSFGRGYTMYEIPQLNSQIPNCINKVYEKRMSGLYEYGNDMLEGIVGKCRRCQKVTKFTCERCHSFYCSKNCQVSDWPQHKVECESIPALVSGVSSVNVTQNQNEQTYSRGISSIHLPLRRPKTLSAPISFQNKNMSRSDLNNEDIINTTARPTNSDIIKSTDQCNTSPMVKTDLKNSTPTQNQNDIINKLKDTKKHKKTIQECFTKTSSKKSQNSLPSPEQTTNQKKSNHFDAKERPNFSEGDVTKMENDIAFSRITFLPKSKFTKVKIIVTEGREYWVQKEEDTDKIIELMTNLQQLAEGAPKMKPVVGELCAVQYECLWHRAVVKSLDPLTVHYIDFGNDEVVDTDDFRDITQLKNVERYAAKIRISKEAYQKYNNQNILGYESIISVKMLSLDVTKVISVEIEGENESAVQSEKNGIAVPEIRNSIPEVRSSTPDVRNSTPEVRSSTPEVRNSTPEVQTPKPKLQNTVSGTPTAVLKALKSSKSPSPVGDDTSKKTVTTPRKPQSVVNTVCVGDSGIIQIHAELSNDIYSVTLLPNDTICKYEKLFQELSDQCDQAVKNSNYKPQIGDLVCGKTVINDEWVRGYVSSLEAPFKIHMIDDASVMEVSQIVPCPENFVDICAFGANCKIIDSKQKFTEKSYFVFNVLAHRKENEIEIKMKDENNVYEVMAVVNPWTPAPEQNGLQYAKLTNKSEVFLTAYRNHIVMFARPVADVKHYHHVMQSVAKCAQTALPLREPPVVGQMVIAHYEDDNYYRAIVTKIEDTKIAVSYVDFGNTEVTKIEKLLILSDELKELRSCTSKIVLRNVSKDGPMTKEISEYLGYLVSAETSLICIFEGTPSTDGVFLKTVGGESVNKTISEMLVPTWDKAAKDDTTCYMKSDLKIATIGAVGDVVDAIVLYSIHDGYSYSMCPVDYELMCHIFDVMPKMMAEYCEKSEHYIPRENELCLAYYDNAWNRAICYCRTETAGMSSVFFVDYGSLEVVPHKDLRLMPKDFMTPNAIANICNIVNLAPTNGNNEYSPEVEKRISELITADSCIKVKIVECDEEDGYYSVEIPSIRDQLIKEGLVTE